MNTPTPKDAELINLPAPTAHRITAHEESLRRAHAAKRAAQRAQIDALRAVQATWPPMPPEHEREMEQCRRRLAEGGEARDRAAAIKRWAVARVPRKGEGEDDG